MRAILLGGLLCLTATCAAQAQVLRGQYIVERVGMCGDCHTPRDEKGVPIAARKLQGAPLGMRPIHPMPFADHAPAIAGLPPNWTTQQTAEFLQTGKRPDGILAAAADAAVSPVEAGCVGRGGLPPIAEVGLRARGPAAASREGCRVHAPAACAHAVRVCRCRPGSGAEVRHLEPGLAHRSPGRRPGAAARRASAPRGRFRSAAAIRTGPERGRGRAAGSGWPRGGGAGVPARPLFAAPDA